MKAPFLLSLLTHKILPTHSYEHGYEPFDYQKDCELDSSDEIDWWDFADVASGFLDKYQSKLNVGWDMSLLHKTGEEQYSSSYWTNEDMVHHGENDEAFMYMVIHGLYYRTDKFPLQHKGHCQAVAQHLALSLVGEWKDNSGNGGNLKEGYLDQMQIEHIPWQRVWEGPFPIFSLLLNYEKYRAYSGFGNYSERVRHCSTSKSCTAHIDEEYDESSPLIKNNVWRWLRDEAKQRRRELHPFGKLNVEGLQKEFLNKILNSGFCGENQCNVEDAHETMKIIFDVANGKALPGELFRKQNSINHMFFSDNGKTLSANLKERHNYYLAKVAMLNWLHLFWREAKNRVPKIPIKREAKKSIDSKRANIVDYQEYQPPLVTIVHCQDAEDKIKKEAQMLQEERSAKKRLQDRWEVMVIPYDGDRCAWAVTELLREANQRPDIGKHIFLISPFATEMPERYREILEDLLDVPAEHVGHPIWNGPWPPLVDGVPPWKRPKGTQATSFMPKRQGFIFPPREVDRRYWKIQYKWYPTGYPYALTDYSVRGDTTSASRLISVNQTSIYLNKPTTDLRNFKSWKTFFVEWDLIGTEEEWLTLGSLITEGFSIETHYLEASRWSAQQARRWDVDMVMFERTLPYQKRCMYMTFQEGYDLAMRGLASPPCIRQMLVDHLDPLLTWWSIVGGNHTAALMGNGGLLYPFRGGKISPWEYDMDITLVTTDPNWDVEEFIAKLEKSGMWKRTKISDVDPVTGVDYKRFYNMESSIDRPHSGGYRLKSQWALMPKESIRNMTGKAFEMDIGYIPRAIFEVQFMSHIMNVRYDVQVMYFPYEDVLNDEIFIPWKFYGTKMYLHEEIWSNAIEYYQPGPKLIGGSATAGAPEDKNKMMCGVPGHNACLPTCAHVTGVDCEFGDHFVHHDYWFQQ